MGRIALGFFLLAASVAARAEQVPTPCGPRIMPPALDFVRLPSEARSSVGFSATPWEYPGRAWVVRAYRSGRSAAAIDIVRLRRQLYCNSYDIEARWQSPLPAADYRALVQATAPLGTPRADAFLDDGPGPDGEGRTPDGTGFELRLSRGGWESRRQLGQEGRGGAAVSAIFHALVAKHVPAAELPAANWRTRGPD